jgi:hypothetical protein
MDEEMIWVPCVLVCRNPKTGDYKLSEFGMKEGGGASYLCGSLLHFKDTEIAEKGLSIVMRSLKAYKIWPAETRFNSEFGALAGAELREFIRAHLFAEVLQRGKNLLEFSPRHRTGGTWREITSIPGEDMPLVMPTTQAKFYDTLMQCFDRAS